MTNTQVKKIPEGMHTVTPHLICAGAAAAIEFTKKRSMQRRKQESQLRMGNSCMPAFKSATRL